MLETAWESRWVPDYYGGVAQLGEHLPCKQGVKSSNLSISIYTKAMRSAKFGKHGCVVLARKQTGFSDSIGRSP